MPRVNKIRISNIVLDDKNKVIGDKTFHLYGENSLFLLENGGGKSSIIQYIHQLVLPNHDMGNRKMFEMVPIGNTIHVAAEWHPDDEYRSPFITGFCYQNTGRKSKETNVEYRYFNYIIECDYDGAYTIEDLPFVLDRIPTTYDELRGKLKSSKGVQLFNQKFRYQEELESFGVLRSEWNNLSLVNGSEGGVTDFFEKANTTQRLLEKLLIPSIIESLYPNEEERESIKNSFKKYSDSLIELPEMKKNLRDYDVINKSSDEIIDLCKEYNELQNQLLEAQTMLSRLYVTLLADSKANIEHLKLIASELEEIELMKNDLNWKIQSFDVLQLEKKQQAAKEKVEAAEENVQNTGKEIARLKREEREQFAARAFEDYRTNQGKLNKVTAELKAIQMEKGERQEAFQKVRNEVSDQYSYLLSLNKTKQQEARSQKARAEKGLKEEESEEKRVGKQNQDKKIQRATRENTVKNYENEMLTLKKILINDWLSDENATYSKLNEQLTVVEEEEKHLNEKMRRIESRITDIGHLVVRNESDRERKQEDWNHAEQDFEVFAEEEIKLIGETYQNLTIQVSDNLFVDHDHIHMKMELVSNQLENEILNKSIAIDDIEKVRRVIEQKGYHIHNELESIKDYLVKKNIGVVLGVDWITKVALDDTAKKELLKKNPLLPVSILIEKGQVSSVKRLLNDFKDELTIPVILIDKSSMEDQDIKEDVYQLEDSSYVFHRFQVRLKMEDWESYLKDLEEKKAGINEEKEELQQKLRSIQKYQRNMMSFWKVYTSTSREDLKSKVDQMAKLVADLDEQKQALLMEQQERQTELAKTEELWKEKDQQKAVLIEKIRKLSDFMERYKDIQAVKKQIRVHDGAIKELELRLEVIGFTIKDWKEKIGQANEEFYHYKSKVDLLRKEADEYEITGTETQIESTEEEFRSKLETYKAFRKDFSEDVRKIERWESSEASYKELISRAISDIKRNEFTLESIEKIGVDFNESLLEVILFDLEELEDKLRSEAAEKDKLTEAFFENKANYEAAVKQIEERFNKGVFSYDSGEESQLELFKSKLALVESDEQKNIDKRKELLSQETQNRTAIEDLETTKEMLNPSPLMVVLKEGEWDKKKPISSVRKLRKDIETKKKDIFNKYNDLINRTNQLQEDAKRTNNTSLIQLAFDISKILESSKNNYEEIINTFVKLMDAVKGYEEAIVIKKKELDRQSSELVELMYERAETVYKNIMEISKSSQVEDKGRILSLFKFYWPKKDIEVSKQSLESFIFDIIDELVKMNNENAKPEEMDQLFNKKVNMINILNCYAESSRCSIKALKHRNDIIAKDDFYDWDIVSKWSDGEKHATQISMFITLFNHLRKKRFAKEDAKKFIILDNPFGKASSDFVVKPMVSLAKKTNTQLFCFTGIKERAIQREFESVISNQYVLQRGRMFMDTEEKHRDTSRAELDTIFSIRG